MPYLMREAGELLLGKAADWGSPVSRVEALTQQDMEFML